MNELIFDEAAWRAHCSQAADSALHGSGQSETMFVGKLHSEIQHRLGQIPSVHRAEAIHIAREFGYLDADELDADAQWNADHGFCTHGIELNHCPVGCESDGDCNY